LSSSKPFTYLFVNLTLIDLRASLPSLLEQINSPEYPALSGRLTSALLIVSSFIAYLLRQMDESNALDLGNFEESFNISPDLLLKLNRSISETLSVVLEFLRDRWDAAVAGAHGLHPEARTGEAHTASGSLRTLAWDSKDESATAGEDPLILGSLKVLGLWLDEDDGDDLRIEASSLSDMLMELYVKEADAAAAPGAFVTIGYRTLVLRVLSGVAKAQRGVEAVLEQDCWRIVSDDLLAILGRVSPDGMAECEVAGSAAALLTDISEYAGDLRSESWLDLVTGLAACDVRGVDDNTSEALPMPLQTLWYDVLELATKLLTGANQGTKRRYVHSAAAIKSKGRAILERAGHDEELRPAFEGLLEILDREPLFHA
jgi:hypothetical protein